MIDCTTAVRRLWEYLDGAVGETDREAIDEHLSVCKRCCGEAEFAHELRKFLQSQEYEDLPAATRDRLSSFIEGL